MKIFSSLLFAALILAAPAISLADDCDFCKKDHEKICQGECVDKKDKCQKNCIKSKCKASCHKEKEGKEDKEAKPEGKKAKEGKKEGKAAKEDKKKSK